MMVKTKYFQRLALAFVIAFSAGCATVEEKDPRDPFESYNRSMHSFNDAVDKALLMPLAKGYQAITPEPVDKGVTNFFGNLADVGSFVNNILQFKLARASSDLGRVVINSTAGVFGLFDVASAVHLEKYREDFGQTLGYWGFSAGPYIVLPLLGPSSVRDTVGRVGDWYLDPVTYIDDETLRYSLRALYIIDKRADLLSASNILDEAALDQYAFMRDAYLQRRENLVADGSAEFDDEAELEDGEIPDDW